MLTRFRKQNRVLGSVESCRLRSQWIFGWTKDISVFTRFPVTFRSNDVATE